MSAQKAAVKLPQKEMRCDRMKRRSVENFSKGTTGLIDSFVAKDSKGLDWRNGTVAIMDVVIAGGCTYKSFVSLMTFLTLKTEQC